MSPTPRPADSPSPASGAAPAPPTTGPAAPAAPAATGTGTAGRLSARTLAGYAAGSLGTGGFATLPGLVLVYYLTDALAVPAAFAGLVVTGAKVWDVLIDPVLGARSDRDLVRTGSRRRFMVAGGVGLPVAFAATFAVPGALPPLAAGLWVLVAFLLAATAFSLFQVPYIALPAELTPRYDERTRLLAWRVAALAVAILLFGAGGPLLRGDGSSLLGYLRMGVVCGLLIGAGMLVAARIAPRGAPREVPASAPAREVVRAAWRDAAAVLTSSQPFRVLLGAFVLQALATGLMLAGAAYVATYLLRDEAALTPLFVALIAPALLTMPLWTALARRVGKERAFAAASALFALAALALTPLAWAPGGWLFVPTALAGIAYAGMQALPMAMLPDVISHESAGVRARPGSPEEHERAGRFAGVWTAGETTGLALGATLLTVVLAVTGFRSSTAQETLTQPHAALTGIAVAFSLVPAALTALSLVLLTRYRLRREHVDGPAEEVAR